METKVNKNRQQEYINSKPTKEFFVEMITRDVTLVSSILDLIDNSLDAIKKNNKPDYESKKIEINYNKDMFVIKDNCGGFSKKTAMEYAFNFGRDNINHDGSIGRFGIGMKRSIFKMGKRFEVKSKTEKESFRVYDDLKEWLGRMVNDGDGNLIQHWAFCLDDLTKIDGEYGTVINIDQLHSSVIDTFLTKSFSIELVNSISKAYSSFIEKGIQITVNGKNINLTKQELLVKRGVLNYSFQKGSYNGVDYQIISGINEPDPDSAGWTIICNERAILTANKESITGWESSYYAENDKEIELLLDKRKVPKYHNTFARFRGYLILFSMDSDSLPYNTTKDSIEYDSEIYQFLLPKMKSQMLIAFEYLRELNKNDEKSDLLRQKLKNAMPVTIEELLRKKTSRMFTYTNEKINRTKLTTLTVKKPVETINKLKKATQKNTNDQLAEYIYNYFITMEGLDE